MLDKERFDRILALALPIVAGMVSQNIFNLVDSAMVSRLEDSDAALAAVGLGGFTLFVTQAIILGFATGVQASASRRKGQGRLKETALFLNAALVIVVMILVKFLPSLLLFFHGLRFKEVMGTTCLLAAPLTLVIAIMELAVQNEAVTEEMSAVVITAGILASLVYPSLSRSLLRDSVPAEAAEDAAH